MYKICLLFMISVLSLSLSLSLHSSDVNLTCHVYNYNMFTARLTVYYRRRVEGHSGVRMVPRSCYCWPHRAKGSSPRVGKDAQAGRRILRAR